MYLDYQTYKLMGGSLDTSAFNTLNRKAEYIINSQAGGKTGERIGKLTELPQAVIDCTYDLIHHLSRHAFDGSNVQSESQSLGGQSESYTYSTMSKSESDNAIDDIIYMYLYPIKINGVSVLYRGV